MDIIRELYTSETNRSSINLDKESIVLVGYIFGRQYEGSSLEDSPKIDSVVRCVYTSPNTKDHSL